MTTERRKARKLTMQEDQALFMDVCGQKRWALEESTRITIKEHGEWLKQIQLYANLIREESEELNGALLFEKDTHREDLAEIADACTDILYVTFGLMNTLGLPVQECWDEVQRSNMAKATACPECSGMDAITRHTVHCNTCNGLGWTITKRPDGKILKPEGWTKPNLGSILQAALSKKD